MAKQFSIVGTLLAVLRICIYYYADPDPGSKESPYGSGSIKKNYTKKILTKSFIMKLKYH